jgi:hypothetical protein
MILIAWWDIFVEINDLDGERKSSVKCSFVLYLIANWMKLVFILLICINMYDIWKILSSYKYNI